MKTPLVVPDFPRQPDIVYSEDLRIQIGFSGTLDYALSMRTAAEIKKDIRELPDSNRDEIRRWLDVHQDTQEIIELVMRLTQSYTIWWTLMEKQSFEKYKDVELEYLNPHLLLGIIKPKRKELDDGLLFAQDIIGEVAEALGVEKASDVKQRITDCQASTGDHTSHILEALDRDLKRE